MKKITFIIGLFIFAAFAPVVGAASNKVSICHATGSATNPFVSISVPEQAIVHGHSKHSNDIIPPISGFAGLNWAAGESTWNNNCVVPTIDDPSPVPTPNVTLPPSDMVNTADSKPYGFVAVIGMLALFTMLAGLATRIVR